MNTTRYREIKPLEIPAEIFNLKGRIGIIVGGAGKMGQQFAKVLSLAGATVVISDLDKEICEKLAHRIETQSGGSVLGLACDVSDQEQVHQMFEHIGKELGRLDFFISAVMGKPDGY